MYDHISVCVHTHVHEICESIVAAIECPRLLMTNSWDKKGVGIAITYQ